eukprot:1140869-Pelagomonas_calceolata.AAC.1
MEFDDRCPSTHMHVSHKLVHSNEMRQLNEAIMGSTAAQSPCHLTHQVGVVYALHTCAYTDTCMYSAHLPHTHQTFGGLGGLVKKG